MNLKTTWKYGFYGASTVRSITTGQHESHRDSELKYCLELISSIFHVFLFPGWVKRSVSLHLTDHLLSPSDHNPLDFFVSILPSLLKEKKALSAFLDICLLVVGSLLYLLWLPTKCCLPISHNKILETVVYWDITAVIGLPSVRCLFCLFVISENRLHREKLDKASGFEKRRQCRGACVTSNGQQGETPPSPIVEISADKRSSLSRHDLLVHITWTFGSSFRQNDVHCKLWSQYDEAGDASGIADMWRLVTYGCMLSNLDGAQLVNLLPVTTSDQLESKFEYLNDFLEFQELFGHLTAAHEPAATLMIWKRSKQFLVMSNSFSWCQACLASLMRMRPGDRGGYEVGTPSFSGSSSWLTGVLGLIIVQHGPPPGHNDIHL